MASLKDRNKVPKSTKDIRKALRAAGVYGVDLMKEGNQYVFITHGSRPMIVATHIQNIRGLTIEDWIHEAKCAKTLH